MTTEPEVRTMSCWARPIIRVRDLSASVAYYRDRLGFEVDWLDRTGPEPSCGQVGRDGVTLILDQNSVFPKASVPSVVSVTLDDSPESPALHELHRELVGSGARVAHAPFSVVWDERLYEMDVEDPDGNVLMFWGHVSR